MTSEKKKEAATIDTELVSERPELFRIGISFSWNEIHFGFELAGNYYVWSVNTSEPMKTAFF